MKTKKIALYGVLVALAFIFSYIEHLIPLPLPTGVKLGAANIVILCALYLLGSREALTISAVRILLSGFAFGIATVPYSLAGGMLSLLVMTILKRKKVLGITGVSVAGSVCHNIGQTLVAIMLLGSNTVFYFPLLFFAGIVAGVLIGIVSALVLKKIESYMRMD
ncbi:MAG: Gx transporter family protein [Lachnospiraceae bacterium]|nr:Gx transporter family protein [Lachnospiraceae bacterium]